MFLQTPHPIQVGWAEAELCLPTSLNPLPTGQVRRFQNAPMGPLRHPSTMPHCLQSYGQFPSPPQVYPLDPNAPPNYEDLFPLAIVLPCACYSTTNPQSYPIPLGLSMRPTQNSPPPVPTPIPLQNVHVNKI